VEDGKEYKEPQEEKRGKERKGKEMEGKD